VIDAFHKKNGEIRRRVPLVKTIASAITIGSGGSAGREGPISQIGAGFGSFIASRLKMSDRERRVMMLCGAAAGIGAIFKAPLGGALFGIEVLYKKDFEMESMVPAIVSSVMAYAVFCSFPNIGWGPIFATPYDYTFNHPYELIFYAILGVACAAAAIVYIKVFYGTRGLFRRLNIPNHLKPAIGGAVLGLLVLLVGYVEPEALDGILGMGYGCIQLAINVKCGLFILLVVAIAKIFATSFTIGSGGSGGIFGPSLVIGAMLGGLFGWFSLYLSHLFFPGAEIITEATLSAFVLVGMAAFFAGAAKVPIAAILMISEMAGSYSLLVPLMLTSVVAYTLSGGWTIYENQEETRKESPAHSREFMVDILGGIKVKDAYTKDVLTIPADKTVKEALYFAEGMEHMTYPVVDKGGKMVGITTIMALEKQREEGADYRKIGLICVKEQDVIVAYPDEFLEDVLRKMDTYNVGRLPVMKKEREEGEVSEELVGIISRSDIIREHCRRWSRIKGESS
jgi:CIC family chloride channel protein